MSYREKAEQAARQQKPRTVLTAQRSKDGRWLRLTVGEVGPNGYVPLSRFVMDYGKIGGVMAGAIDKLTVAELPDNQRK